LHSLSVNVGTNLLSLVSPWLDKFCQITTKDATVTFHLLFTKWTHPKLKKKNKTGVLSLGLVGREGIGKTNSTAHVRLFELADNN
jgi:hypothetical protein